MNLFLASLLFTWTVLAEEQPTSSFLQISDDGSGTDSGGLDDTRKVLIIFGLNLIFCLLCCGVLQWAMDISKKYSGILISLRKNHQMLEELRKLKNLAESSEAELGKE